MKITRRVVVGVAAVLSFYAISIGVLSLNADGALRGSSIPKGVVHGQVLLGPTCPVERIPPDPACAPKPYKTTIIILRTPTGATYKKVTTDASGHFTISLMPGTYTFRALSTGFYPRCVDTRVKVIAKKSQTIKVNCDTGIR